MSDPAESATTSKETAASEPTDSQPTKPRVRSKFKKMDYSDAVIGHEIHNYWGSKVIEHTTVSGDLLALKVRPIMGLHHSEADLTNYAATHGILAPKVQGVYDVQTDLVARVMAMERVPGVPLSEVWESVTDAEKASYTEQLRIQIHRMRELTQPFIGRVGRKSGEQQPLHNIYDRLFQNQCGPFQTEKEFDDWCLARVLPKVKTRFGRYKWKRFVEREREHHRQDKNGAGSPGGRFVLTHGDLRPANIMVKDGVITGIIDWGRGGFYPEYAEYAFAMELSPATEKSFLPVLKEILTPGCSKGRLKFTQLCNYMGHVDLSKKKNRKALGLE